MTHKFTRRQGISAIAALALMTSLSLPTTVLSGEENATPIEGINMIISGPENQIATYKTGRTGDMPIIFLHGDSGRASQWDPVMQLLDTGISFDFSGHGASEPHGAGDYSFKARAADMQAVVTAHSLDQFVIVAHSGSVGVAFEYAGAHADQVAGILLIDPATDARQMPAEMRQGFLDALSGPDAAEAVKGYYASIAGSNPTVIAQVQADADVVHPDARIGIATTLLSWNPEDAVAHYDGPVEVMITPFNDNPAAIYHLMNGVTPTVISDTGHWIQLDAPEVIADAVKDFILTLKN